MEDTSFDYEYYEQIKTFVASTLKGRPMFFEGNAVDWAVSKLELVSYCIEKEDYEGAKATSDAVRDFLNSFLPDNDKIPESATFKLPKYEQKEIHGIICLCKPDDLSGMESGGVITF